MLKKLMMLRVKPLDALIKGVESEMLDYPTTSKEYKLLLKNLERLRALQDNNRPERLNRNTIALVVGTLLGILTIVVYVQYHPYVSKPARETIKHTY